jgi:hypothetical protein
MRHFPPVFWGIGAVWKMERSVTTRIVYRGAWYGLKNLDQKGLYPEKKKEGDE